MIQNHQPDAHLPLEGVRILAAEQMIASPIGTQLLADLGAEVIKVERPKVGEQGRINGPFFKDWNGETTAATMYRANRNKKSIALELTKKEGQEIFKSLAQKVDVVVENFRPGFMEGLGLGYEDLKTLNPHLVYVSISGYGHEDLLPSPYSAWAAYGNIGESMGGVAYNLIATSKDPDVVASSFHGLSLGDIFSSLNGMIGLLTALYDAKTTGTGRHVDVAMMDSLFLLTERPMIIYSLTGKKPAPNSMLPFIIGEFKAQDGWFTLGVLNDKHWKAFCEIIGREELIDKPEFDTAEKRGGEVDTFFKPIIEEWAKNYTKHEAAQKFRDVGIAAAPVMDPEDLSRDPHIAARKMLMEFDIAEGKKVQVVGNPIKMTGVETKNQRPPLIGEHTEAVLKELLDYDDEQLQELYDKDVIDKRDV